MSIHASPPREPGDQLPFAVGAPHRYDAIGAALTNAFAPGTGQIIPPDMAALLACLNTPWRDQRDPV